MQSLRNAVVLHAAGGWAAMRAGTIHAEKQQKTEQIGIFVQSCPAKIQLYHCKEHIIL
jgi:hypothetical protein